MPNTNGYRFIRGANQDNTARTQTQDMRTLTYAATIALKPVAQQNLFMVALTGALTVTADIVNPKWGDVIEMQFAADGTNRVVTFTTGFATAGTLTVVANKFGNMIFTFTDNGWIETGRTLTA